ncbi:MAG: hypothetical protein ACOCZ5_01395 [bacterium]
MTRIIELTRRDLIDNKKDKPLYNITIGDFKSTVLTIKDVEQAFIVIFKDDNGMSRFLKHRNDYL